MKIRGIVNKNKRQKHVAFYSVVYVQFLTDQIFTLGRFCLLLFKIDNVKQKTQFFFEFIGGTGLTTYFKPALV